MSTGLTFIELCAGTAALSVRLQGGQYARPPVSRMGAKTGYSKAILSIMGLRAGQGAERFVWAEPDDGCRLLLHAYAEPALARDAARQLEQWVDEDPRALWDRLKAEPVTKAINARTIARMGLLMQWSFRRGFINSGFRPSVQTGLLQTNTTNAANPRNAAMEAALYAALPSHSALICSSASDVPYALARWLVTAGWSWRGNPKAGFNKSEAYGYPAIGKSGPKHARDCNIIADDMQSLAEHPALICSSASDVPLPDVLTTLSGRCVVYIDPPYQNTTGYAHDLTRDEVIALARLWSDAGAAVYISEAEPLDLPGWHQVNITGCRVGQRRTFSKQQAEYITCSQAPAWVPAEQGSLF